MERVRPKDIHKGDILWECFQGGSYQVEILTEPKHKDGQWTWTGRNVYGKGEFLVTDGYEHYGPRMYKQPVYFPEFPLATPEEGTK